MARMGSQPCRGVIPPGLTGLFRAFAILWSYPGVFFTLFTAPLRRRDAPGTKNVSGCPKTGGGSTGTQQAEHRLQYALDRAAAQAAAVREHNEH